MKDQNLVYLNAVVFILLLKIFLKDNDFPFSQEELSGKSCTFAKES